jgi:hypothetical protein
MMKQSERSGVGVWLFRCGLTLGSVAGMASVAAPEARAQDENPTKAECAQAYESSQESRAAGHLQETRQKLSVCARSECPSFVQKDCSRWLQEVERELPSIVVQATGLASDEARTVSIAIDGSPIPDALAGTAVALDPGRHELVAQRPGHEPLTRIIVAQQGVQNRAITLDFAEALAPPPSPPADEPRDVSPESSSSLRPYAYVAWGVGAIGLGAFAMLGTLGRADEQALKDDCPNATTDPALVSSGVCYKADVDERKDDYERKFLFADIGLVTGIVGVAAGTTLFILSATDGGSSSAAARHTGNSARWQLDVSPTTGGAYASVAGAF